MNTLKWGGAVLCLFGLIAAGIYALPGEGDDASMQLAELQKKMEELESRVRFLEKRLSTLHVPKNWKKFEHEGVVYYAIPLADNVKAARKFKK